VGLFRVGYLGASATRWSLVQRSPTECVCV